MKTIVHSTLASLIIAGLSSSCYAGYWSYKWNAPDPANCTINQDKWGEDAWWCEDNNGGGIKQAIDLMIYGGKIYTADQSISDPSQRFVKAVAIKDNKIVFTGSKAKLEEQFDVASLANKNKLNLKGASAVPGFHDLHMHPLEAGSEIMNCSLSSSQNMARIKTEIKKCLNNPKTNGVIFGHGHSILQFIKESKSPLAILDSVSSTTPILIMEETSHSVWANSAALKKLGINRTTPDPTGGHIVKDERGNPNGLLLDSSGDNAFHSILDNPSNAIKNDNYYGLEWALKEVSKRGITSFVNARVYWQRKNQDVWRKAANNNLIKARAHMALWVYPENTPGGASARQISQQVNQINNIRIKYDNPSKNLHFDHIKFYSDGITINTTADFVAPYNHAAVDKMHLGVNANNRSYIPTDDMAAYIAELEPKGFTAMIHAIGDKGVRSGLDAIKLARDSNQHAYDENQRHRLTHLEFIDHQDMPRFATENVIADFQVAGSWTLPGHRSPEETALLGQKRMAQQLPIGEAYRAGAQVVLSSDWDVSELLPLVGIEHSLKRGRDGSLPNIYAAVDAYTAGAAHAIGHDDQVGQIKPGMLADITILSTDIFALANEGKLDEIGENIANDGGGRVNKTIFDGKIIYSR